MSANRWVFLFLILILATFLRVFYLSESPPSLNWDEVSHAYNAYALLTTGRDQWGQILPIINFRAYGDYPTALNLYMTVPFLIFGNTDFTVRLPHVLSGVLTVLVLFIAGAKWFKSYRVGLWIAFIAAISPWLIWPSRQVIQSNWVVLLACLGLAYYAKNKINRALLLWGLGLFAYHNMRIFLPTILIAVMILKRRFVLPIFLFIISGVILLLPVTSARSAWVSIINPGSVAKIENWRNTSSLPSPLVKLFYNRPAYFVATFFRNTIEYLGPGFLFLEGGTQYQFSLPGWGLLPWVFLPLFYLGLLKTAKEYPFLLAWLFLAIVPAAITIDQRAVIRATLMSPVVIMIAGLGISVLKNDILKYLIVFSSFLFISFYAYHMVYYYPSKYSQSWQYGYKQAVQIIKEKYKDVDKIVFTKRYGEPHEFILWYLSWNPNDYKPKWDYHSNWYWVDSFDKFTFVNDWEMKSQIFSPKTLIISSPENESIGGEIARINFLDGQPAFIIKTI